MVQFLLTNLIWIFYLTSSSFVFSSNVTLRLSLGTVVGRLVEINTTSAEIYNSIPYAEAPLEELRFEHPQPLRQSLHNFDTAFSVSCLQLIVGAHARRDRNESEDCLYMKVIVPLDEHGKRYKEKLPAVFWIHGGSFSEGSKESYGNEQIVKHFSKNKIVFVAVNYRLGLLGFMTALHTDLPGNYGLEDIIMALKVFVDNSDEFGINKSQITIAGESAGAAAASILAVSPRSRDLISSAILASGSSLAPWAIRSSFTDTNSALFINKCDCVRDSVYEMKLCMKIASLDCIRNIYKEILRDYFKFPSWYELVRMGLTVFTPIMDSFRMNDSIIPIPIEHLVQMEGRKPILVSTTLNEREDKMLIREIGERILVEHPTKIPTMEKAIESLVPSTIPSAKNILDAMKKRYFKTEKPDFSARTVRKLGVLLTKDLISNSYHESLLYAQSNTTVYAIENKCHDSNPCLHGHDIKAIFQQKPSCRGCSTETEFAENFADLLVEFIKTKTIENLNTFGIARHAYQMSRNGSKSIDWHTEDYYFWKHSIHLLESLHMYAIEPIIITECPFTKYVEKALIVCSISIFALLVLFIICAFRRPRKKVTQHL